MKAKRLFILLFIVIGILIIPFIATLLNDEFYWTISDFVLAGILLFCTGLIIELVIRKVSKIKYRITIIFAILIFLAIIWAEIAVGVFDALF